MSMKFERDERKFDFHDIGCEIKRKREIGEEIESEVSRKVARLSIRKDKSVRTVLVYDGNLHPIVRSNAYFDALIDIADLMKQ